MPNVSIATIRTALATKLGEVTELKEVHLGRHTDFSVGFPACRHYLIGVGSDQVENQPSDYRMYPFAIDVIQLLAVQDVALTEAAFQDAIEAVVDKLNAQWNLGNVDGSIIERSTVQALETAQGPAIRLPIIFQARTLIY